MTTLRPLLLDTRDGEWGKGDPAEGRVEMRVIRGTDFAAVREGQVDGVPVRYLEQRHADRKRLQPWDIVFETAGGSPDRPTGRSILLTPRTFELLGDQITCASFARFLRVDPEQADPAFVFWMLQHHYDCRDLLQFHTQHTGVARFQFTTFSNTFDFDLPLLDTQRRIASVLGAYDDLIEVNRRRVAVLEEMARGLFEEWFVRFRFPGHENVNLVATPDGPLPQGWSSRMVGDFGDVITGKTPSKKCPEYFGGEVPFVKIPDLHGCTFIHDTSEALSETGASTQRKKTLPSGTLCVSCIGTIGLVAITTQPCQTNQQINAVVPTSSVCLEFLYFSLKRARGALVNLGSNGATMGNVNKQKFETLRISSPPIKLITAFHAHCSPMMQMVRNLELSNMRLAASRDLLLPRLISGRLSVETAKRELELAA